MIALAILAALGILGLGVFVGTLIKASNPSQERPTVIEIHPYSNTSTLVAFSRSGQLFDSEY